MDHKLILAAEENLRWSVLPGCNVCPEAVAEGQDFYSLLVYETLPVYMGAENPVCLFDGTYHQVLGLASVP